MSGSPSFELMNPFGPEAWDEGNSGFMQSRTWASFKSGTGWKAWVCRPSGSPESAGILALEKPLAAGLRFAYVPFGPERLPEGPMDATFLKSLSGALAAASGKGLLFVRFDLPHEREAVKSGGEGRIKGLYRGNSVQVPDTVILDLRPDPDTILAGMKPKWRYNIRLAEKKGVLVSRESSGSLNEFYGLYRKTASRDGIAIHPISYYETLFRTFEAAEGKGEAPGSLSLWVARNDGEAIASIITLFHRGHATYLYGASSGENRNLMPAYALQWSAIQAARDSGCIDYDLFGIPPDDDPRHPMAGLYLFKTGFGGKILHRAGAFDLPLNLPAYLAFRFLESARRSWYKGFKKTLARMRRSGGQRKTSPSKA